jgi:hypothetical protein
MAVDFKTNRIRAYSIIASGSQANAPGIWIQGSGSALDFTGGSSAGLLSKVGNDTFLFVSGGIGQKGVSSSKSVAVFGGDLVTSGTLYALNGVSGSLTRLADGSSYLVAGTSIAITTGSSGQVTIAATAGGSPGGASGDVQFNNGTGGFLGESSFNYNSTTNILLVDNVKIASNLEVSGSTYIGDNAGSDFLYVNSLLASNIIPDGDRTRNLGSPASRFANIYTGDLHLRNDRGDWTIVEEEDFLCVVNNKTGKRYKMMLQPLE